MSKWRVGIDVGGTFTDGMAVNEETGEIRNAKVLSTPEAPAGAVLEALWQLNIPVSDVSAIHHGFTVGINAFLTRTGTRAGLLCTTGFRDLLDIGRLHRPFGAALHDPTWIRPHQERPLIERRYRRGIPGRIVWDGTERVPLDEDAVRREVEFLKKEGVESVAICFINSYLNPSHEQRARQIVKEMWPEVYIQTSEANPVAKESERTTLLAVDVYTGPLTVRYLDDLARRLREAGYKGDVLIMQISGGMKTLAATRQFPVNAIESGPVGGIAGCQLFGETLGIPNILGLDIGGTSTDIGVVREGRPVETSEVDLEHGITVMLPMVEVNSIGAGGGSLIQIDEVGSLRVGPESAGARPGPACYGFGGTKPTLTDAYVIMGIIQPELFLGGRMRLDRAAAERALQTVAGPLGMTPVELATGAFDLATANIAGSIRGVTIERGLDPRQFVLFAYGAAGPIHAARLAKDASIGEVVVPIYAGGFSALGLLSPNIRVDCAESVMKLMPFIGAQGFNTIYQRLEEKAKKELAAQGVDPDRVKIQRWYYGMYYGQTWDNKVAAPGGTYTDATLFELKAGFDDFFEKNFGYKAQEIPAMVTTLSVTAEGEIPSVKPAPVGKGGAEPPAEALKLKAAVHFAGKDYPSAPFYDGPRLLAGNIIEGPAIIDARISTVVIPEGMTGEVDKLGNLHIKARR